MESDGNLYTPSQTQQSQQNSNATGLLNQQTGTAQGYAPAVTQQAQGLTQQFINNPYTSQAQTGANAAGAYGTGTVAPMQQQGAAALQGAGAASAGYIPQVLETGFDPQNALYNQKFQQNRDQANATNAMNGIAGTPYGAGVSNQSNTNFNLDWLDRALGRQTTAANTAATLGSNAHTGFQGASDLGTAAINTQATSGALPASTYGDNLARDIAALSGQNTAVGGANQVTDQALQNILAYLGYGTSAGQAASKAQSDTFSGLGNLAGLGLSFL